MAIVTFRYWAAAKDAAGATEEQVAALTLAEALARAGGSAPSAPCSARFWPGPHS